MQESSPGEITVLLHRWQQGDHDALDQLMPLVYPRLKAIAGSIEGLHNSTADLQTTALVNEAFLRLVNQKRVDWEGREHFFSLAALAMRQILTDHARAAISAKRGGNLQRIPIHDQIPWVSIQHEELFDLNTAVDELAAFDPRKARVVELRYYLGCTANETAEILGISKATVDRECEVARAWLFRRLNGG